MKKNIFLLLLSFLLISTSFSQVKEFTIIKKLPVTPVKNQANSGTCWCFATTSFIESELIRKGKGKFNLSEMFTVRNIYKEKAVTHIRMQGHNFFTAGGQAHNVMFVLNNLGAVPENIYTGRNSGERLHNHTKLDSLMLEIVTIPEDDKNKGLTNTRLSKIDSVLDVYLGTIPQEFDYKGNKYTPKTYLSDILEINPNDYIEITSFAHKPYYEKFCLQDKFNWASNLYLNIPFDEFFEIIDYALDNGYTINWNGDVSEKGFDFYKGTAVLNIKAEEATAELRQELYNTQETTVDHLMNIVGTATDENGMKFYIIKNSWGKYNPYKGYMYMSETYLKLKTVSITVNKEAIPKNILQKIKN